MSTKVKGEAIKEGSIPLSALSQEVKNKIENAGGGADWNAQEGEAGYIENRTHYSKTLFSKFIEPESELSEYNTEIKDVNVNRFPDINYIEILTDGIALEVLPVYFNCGETNIISKYIEEEDVTITLSCIDIDGERTIKVEFSNVPLNFDVTTIGILGVNISFLSEKYIPDTVIKTTLQTLTDTDKNQALANLGIDPVVWKYMCDPIMVVDGKTVPTDIIDIYARTLPLNCFSSTTNEGSFSWGIPLYVDTNVGVVFYFIDEGTYVARIVDGKWVLEEY